MTEHDQSDWKLPEMMKTEKYLNSGEPHKANEKLTTDKWPDVGEQPRAEEHPGSD